MSSRTTSGRNSSATVQGLGAVVGDPHVLAVEPGQQPGQAPGGVDVVVHDQDSPTGRLAGRPPADDRLGVPTCSPGLLEDGQPDDELAARCPARRCGRRSSRRASRRASGPGSGRSPGRPGRARGGRRPGRTSRRSAGSISGSIPMPVSRTRSDDLAALRLDDQVDPAAGLGVLGGVVQQVPEHLLQPGRVGLQADRPVGQRDGQLMAALVDLGAGGLDRLADDRAPGPRPPCAGRSCPG